MALLCSQPALLFPFDVCELLALCFSAQPLQLNCLSFDPLTNTDASVYGVETGLVRARHGL